MDSAIVEKYNLTSIFYKVNESDLEVNSVGVDSLDFNDAKTLMKVVLLSGAGTLTIDTTTGEIYESGWYDNEEAATEALKEHLQGLIDSGQSAIESIETQIEAHQALLDQLNGVEPDAGG